MTETVISIISIVIAGLSLVVSAILLLFNRLTLKEVKKQNERVARSIESDTISKIATSQQTILFKVLSDDPANVKEVLKGFAKTGLERNAVYGTIMLNHLNMVYTFRKKGFLGNDEWVGLQNDIRDSFSKMSNLSKRWSEIKTTYSTDFQNFIDNLVNYGRLE